MLMPSQGMRILVTINSIDGSKRHDKLAAVAQ